VADHEVPAWSCTRRFSEEGGAFPLVGFVPLFLGDAHVRNNFKGGYIVKSDSDRDLRVATPPSNAPSAAGAQSVVREQALEGLTGFCSATDSEIDS
jgi:hypothetical protein